METIIPSEMNTKFVQLETVTANTCYSVIHKRRLVSVSNVLRVVIV